MDISVFDTDFNLEAVLDVYESFIWTDRYRLVGDFEIYTEVSNDLLNILKNDYYLKIEGTDHAMIVEKRQITTDPEDGNKLITTGRSIESILGRRIIWGQKTITGNLQDGIIELLNENVISPIDSDRQIANFTIDVSTDPIITALSIDVQYMGDNLYDAIFKICDANDLGFKVLLIDGIFIFSLYAGVDRSYDQVANPYVVFSPEFDNILDSNSIESSQDLKTTTLIAGEGEGSARKMTTVDGIETNINRRELFTDASDISQLVDNVTIPDAEYLAQLEQRGLESLAEKKVITSFDGQVEATILYTYDQDFFMGDIVQVANEYGSESRSRITEVIRSNSLTGLDIYPTFTKMEV